jgi:hypothetical protein
MLTQDIEFALPPLRTHSNVKGLIAAFIDPIPMKHGEKLYQSMDVEQVRLMKSLVYDFIPVFYELARNVYDQSMKVKALTQTFDMEYERPFRETKALRALEAVEESSIPSDSDDVEVETSFLRVLVKDKPEQKASPLPCSSMLKTGKCTKGPKCTFSHVAEDLYKAWTTAFHDLQNSPFNPRNKGKESKPSRVMKLTAIDEAELDLFGAEEQQE